MYQTSITSSGKKRMEAPLRTLILNQLRNDLDIHASIGEGTTLSTIQYLGSKSRLIPKILPLVKKRFPNAESFVDLFAGAGSVAFAFQSHVKRLYANDIQRYSYVLLDAILNGANLSEAALRQIMKNAEQRANELKSVLSDAIKKEQHFREIVDAEEIFEDYKKFCDETPHVYKPTSKMKCFKPLAELAKKIKPGKRPVAAIPPCLFITYYANTYFGIEQCMEIDSIRRAIEDVEDTAQKNIMLAALMSAMSYAASSTTHFAQYLKVNDERTAKHLIHRRSVSIASLLLEKLDEYRKLGLLNRNDRSALCGNYDYLDFLDQIRLDEKTVIYADPPYFKEHYSRYYHLLDTLCLYDYPVLTQNPRLDGITVGRYRDDRSSSPFGKRSGALKAFGDLFEKSAATGANLVISYSNNSIVSLNDLINIASQYCDVEVSQFPLSHSRQGRSEITQVLEIVLLARPRSKADSRPADRSKVNKLLRELETMKPLYDNPAAAIHSYVARKPYNILAKIVERLTDSPDDIVCDPFAGSGTTLIEALKQGHSVVGVDINKQSILIMETLFSGWKVPEAKRVLEKFYAIASKKMTNIYRLDVEGGAVLERCHFDLKKKGLYPTAYWYKKIENGVMGTRKKKKADKDFIESYRRFERKAGTIFRTSKLIENKRIAVQQGASVADYLCARNKLSMKILTNELNKIRNRRERALVELVLSSALNLIRLSDKKASSQIPYWRPKRDLTSRNPIIILKDKIDLCLQGIEYAEKNFPSHLIKSVRSIRGNLTPNSPPAALVAHCPIQDVRSSQVPSGSIDLIVTDPPYTDQVPYLEYSQLWSRIFKWNNLKKETLQKEVIVSNAKTRRGKDLHNFNNQLGECFRRYVSFLKEEKYCAIFFHDFLLPAWSNLLISAEKAGLAYQGEVRIGRQRRSFKTVLTPNKTLDGNYLILFKKRKIHPRTYFGNMESAVAAVVGKAKQIIRKKGGKATMQDLYDGGLLRDCIESGSIHLLADKYRTFGDVLKGKVIHNNGFWVLN